MSKASIKKIGLTLLVLLAILGLFYIVQLLFIFLMGFGKIASQSEVPSVYKLLADVDWETVGWIFLIFALLNFIADFLTLVLIGSYKWYKKSCRHKASIRHEIFGKYWTSHKRVHVVYGLLTLFFTIGTSAPAQIMNTFTAIVSISTFVISLSKINEDKD